MPAEGNTSYERLKLSMTKEQLSRRRASSRITAPAPRQTTGTGAGLADRAAGIAARDRHPPATT